MLDEAIFLPHEVVVLRVEHAKPMLRAWREHLGLTQAEVARRMDISQPAYAKLEAPTARLRVSTLKRLATALGVQWEQLREL